MNKYSPLLFSGLLIIPLALSVVHAQDSGSSSNDPFSKMFNQAREQSREKIVQGFAQAQQNATPPFGGAAGASRSSQQTQSTQDSNKSSTPSSSPAAPGASIPAASVNPTNTGSAPANIYGPPPQSPAPAPTQPAMPSSPAPQNKTPIPQPSANLYG